MSKVWSMRLNLIFMLHLMNKCIFLVVIPALECHFICNSLYSCFIEALSEILEVLNPSFHELELRSDY